MTKQHPEKIAISKKKKGLQMHINAIAKCDVFQVYFVLVRIQDSVKYICFLQAQFKHSKLSLYKSQLSSWILLLKGKAGFMPLNRMSLKICTLSTHFEKSVKPVKTNFVLNSYTAQVAAQCSCFFLCLYTLYITLLTRAFHCMPSVSYQNVFNIKKNVSKFI